MGVLLAKEHFFCQNPYKLLHQHTTNKFSHITNNFQHPKPHQTHLKPHLPRRFITIAPLIVVLPTTTIQAVSAAVQNFHHLNRRRFPPPNPRLFNRRWSRRKAATNKFRCGRYPTRLRYQRIVAYYYAATFWLLLLLLFAATTTHNIFLAINKKAKHCV